MNSSEGGGDGGGLTQRKKQETSFDVVDRVEKLDEPKQYVGYGFKEDKSLWVKFKAPLVGEIRFNPIVSFFSIALIWIFVGVCIGYSHDNALGEGKNILTEFKVAKRYIVEKFTWLYIGSQDLWAVFAIILYFSKYADLKLGKPNEKPEYNDVTWFVMLFACGIGVGLFFFGVAEPIFHYIGPNRYTMDPTMPDNTVAQVAINITLYHWGIHGWIVYCLVGLLLALMTYRENLPMTMKSCFYPLIGDRIFGWIGDAIDVISVMTTLFGVCTSLGLGTRQLNTGFNIVNPEIDSENTGYQVAIIWVITAIATVSTVSGVGMGIRRLSETCFGFGMFLMLIALFMDNTFYILNLFVQSLGYYLQYIIQLGWHTDAFEQLDGGSAHKSAGRFIPEGYKQPDGPQAWMDDWTMFYWGWWISWSPFVGMFIAKISRGRTIRQFINGTLTAPVFYSIMWMVIFGGAGIRMEREASNNDLCCPKYTNSFGSVDETWFRSPDILANSTHENGLAKVIDLDKPLTWGSSLETEGRICYKSDAESADAKNNCGKCAKVVLGKYVARNGTAMDFLNDYKTMAGDFGSTELDRTKSRLSCHRTEQMWFDVMRSYGGLGTFLSVFSLFSIVLYFVTSSDSGSLVIDCLTSNGDPDPPKIQRVFWALMEGATATALLVAGGKDALDALQTAGVVSGLPYTFIICILCVALWRAVKVAAGDLDAFGPTFAVGLFDCLFAQPLKTIRSESTKVLKLFMKFLSNIVLAPYTIGQVSARLSNSRKPILHCIAPIMSFALFIIFHLAEIGCEGCWSIGWFFYLVFVTLATSVRLQCRDRFNIIGNPFEDFFATLFMYPCVAVQLDETTKCIKKDNFKQKQINVEMAGKKEDVENGKVNEAFEKN